MSIEHSILSGLVDREEYARAVFPYIKPEYFELTHHRAIFDCYSDFFNKFSNVPSKEALKLKIDNHPVLDETSYKDALELLDVLESDPKTEEQFLVEETEKFCQDRAIYLAVRDSIMILDGKDKKRDKGAIPKLLEEAIGVSFNSALGIDYLEDYEERYKYLNRKESKIRLDIDMFNKITNGGFSKGSLICFLAATGVGKSLIMCHLAGQAMLSGYNVLYISAELNKYEVSQRIDANLLDVSLNDIKELPFSTFEKRLNRIKEKSPGKLIVEEYPTGSAHVGHFRHLLNELKNKKKFKPDIIFIDYINICASSRMKSMDSSYAFVKAIAEELRGLGMEYGVPVVTATQVNRSGYNSSDLDLTSLSESMGVAHTTDLMCALISNEELEEMGQIIVKQLKNRWGNIYAPSRFVLGIVREKMRLLNIDSDTSIPVTKKRNKSTDSVESDTPIPSVSKASRGKIDKSKVSGMTF